MAVIGLEEQQDALTPKEDLTQYAGQWVALRDGYVIANDLDPVALRDRDDVHEDDILIPVPTAEDGIFIL